jgi:hypothetical protein
MLKAMPVCGGNNEKVPDITPGWAGIGFTVTVTEPDVVQLPTVAAAW